MAVRISLLTFVITCQVVLIVGAITLRDPLISYMLVINTLTLLH